MYEWRTVYHPAFGEIWFQVPAGTPRIVVPKPKPVTLRAAVAAAIKRRLAEPIEALKPEPPPTSVEPPPAEPTQADIERADEEADRRLSAQQAERATITHPLPPWFDARARCSPRDLMDEFEVMLDGPDGNGPPLFWAY